MGSSMVSRWPAVVSVALAEGELDDDGLLTRAAVERLFAAGRAAYLVRTSIDPDAIEVRLSSIRQTPGSTTVATADVAVGVVEIFSECLSMAARIRSGEADGVTAEATCSVSVPGGVTTAIRDELIALAHGAAHVL